MTDTSNINEMSEKYKKILDEGCIILDTETTDLYGEVIELAIINNEGSVLFNHRIKPKEQKIKPNAEAIHHISMEMLKDEKELSFYMDELTDIFTKYKNLVIYNAAFDIECLNVS
ncbi:3'-5' exonuclease, partial [Enterobacter hormaechei]